MAMQIAASSNSEPMMEINTTPLIDVMLVLLIMFIITIPLQTHSVKLDLPQRPPKPPVELLNPLTNKVVVTGDGRVLWNGTQVSMVVLRQLLDMSTTMVPVPELHLQPEPEARYELVDEVLAVTKRANVRAMGFVGNEAYASF